MVENTALDWRVEQDLLVETITEDNLRQLLEKVIMNDAVITCMYIVIFTRFIQLLMLVHVRGKCTQQLYNVLRLYLYVHVHCIYLYVHIHCMYI